MAAPRNSFRAHDGCALRAAQRRKLSEPTRKFFGLHVVGVTAKARIAPSGVGGIGPRMAQTAQRAQRHVFDTLRSQCDSQRVAVELRVMARARHSPDIDEAFDALAFEQRNELIERQSRMSDREYRMVGPVCILRQGLFAHELTRRVASGGP